MRIRTFFAASTTLAIAALGTSAVAADAFAGQGTATHAKGAHAHGNGHGQDQSKDHGTGHGKGHGKGHGHSSSDDSGSTGNQGGGSEDSSAAGTHGKGHGNAGTHGKGHGNAGGKGGKGGGHNPAGNNGTIKVDNAPFDDAPNNEPHVSCTFQIDFYGYDEGDLYADVDFEAHAPTTSPSGANTLLTDTVFIGEDDASGGGSEAGLDASKTYTLTFGDITPHAKQGYHVKLTIHADGSQGADTKHKVFWVQPCEDTTTPSTPTTPTTPTTPGGDQGGTTPGGETPGTETPGTETPGAPGGTDTEVKGEQATSNNGGSAAQQSTDDTEVAGVQASAGNKNLPTQVNSGGNVLDFVTSPVPLLLIALGLALGIFGLARRSRRA